MDISDSGTSCSDTSCGDEQPITYAPVVLVVILIIIVLLIVVRGRNSEWIIGNTSLCLVVTFAIIILLFWIAFTVYLCSQGQPTAAWIFAFMMGIVLYLAMAQTVFVYTNLVLCNLKKEKETRTTVMPQVTQLSN